MPTTGIDFGTLSLKDALDFAILVEEEARDRYLELAEQMRQFHSPAPAALFEKMARNEELHRSELLARREASFAAQPSVVTRSMIFDVEAPEYDDARAFMTQRDAVGVALKSEIKAHEFFLGLAEKAEAGVIRTLFQDLAREELGHQHMLREELERMPADDQVLGDVGDEPVAL